MRQLVGLFGIILAASLLVGLPAEPRGPALRPASAPAPDFVVAATEGAPVRLQALRGRPVWLSFFSSWCAYCRAENPDIQAIHEEQRRNGGDLAIVMVGDGETITSAAEYARNAGLTLSIAADPDRAVALRYGVVALPTHVFIDRQGFIKDVRIGALPPEAMRRLVGALE